MTSEHRPQDDLEEAPAGASSEESTDSLEDDQRSGDERRFGERRSGQDQRAGVAAYAAAQGGAPHRPTPGAAPGNEPTETEAHAEEDGGLQVQQDLHELASKAEKAEEYLALAQRTQADFENYRKRAARDAALAQDRGVAKLAKELLPAIDNLDRALKAASEENSPLAEGIKLVHTDLLSALQRLGVEPFSPDGEQFDPQLHEAVAQQPVEGVESGFVAEVFQQGFRLGETVLRPARVLVAA
ncbi:MAG TPA: nucleotide exchange factor GrpE [Solirubrobacteraceae bacterium]|jgi:molecular chaperone GrpE|nr:nucleotide exchange factor GrpE [Solirubrobacteraceae bacterium]